MPDTNKNFLKRATQNVAFLLEEEMKSKVPVSSDDQVIIDSIPYAICWKDKSAVIIGCNSSFLKLLGMSRADCIGQKINHLFGKEESEALQEITSKVISYNSPEDFIIEMDEVKYESNEGPLIKDGKVIGTVLTITKQVKNTEKQKAEIIEGIDGLMAHVQYMKQKNA